ncbi:NAD-dependent epimerase/dehydratase family protein [Aquirufa aurantiipilula]|uniref:NAD-dependent epimerase/dehydratase family protein n=1 Tax=Aquirufa aurantiipilula TaxID=2696561 RepID=UPI001CAA6711|nr:NAD-dependent epimerase/dehydratase family protein [Aquirufa aurantiipilula]MBZ1327264.1 NAD-dependent epimerase/dehydratase family protein [Aquirufa aurantiipilula]
MKNSKIKVIVTGVTGMVGEGVMHECLLSPYVEEVLVISRRPSGKSHPKLKEIILTDFYQTEELEELVKGYDACYFCLGVTSIGKNEAEYTKLTYDLTLGFAKSLEKNNPQLTFVYVSGKSTDSTEKGNLMWARVKGKTENDLAKLKFKAAFAFRPGMIHPTPGLQHALPFYKYINWMYPFLRWAAPNMVCTMKELGQAMIAVTLLGYDKSAVEVADIVHLSKVLEEK